LLGHLSSLFGIHVHIVFIVFYHRILFPAWNAAWLVPLASYPAKHGRSGAASFVAASPLNFLNVSHGLWP
jgi:hypothetical protein